jgi:hypothetical protein
MCTAFCSASQLLHYVQVVYKINSYEQYALVTWVKELGHLYMHTLIFTTSLAEIKPISITVLWHIQILSSYQTLSRRGKYDNPQRSFQSGQAMLNVINRQWEIPLIFSREIVCSYFSPSFPLSLSYLYLTPSGSHKTVH